MITPRLFAATACTALTGNDCTTTLPKAAASSANVQHLLQIVFGVFGALAVLMIVIGSLNFINSEGDSQKVANARNTMVYALVGLVVAISAEVIVSFVLGHF